MLLAVEVLIVGAVLAVLHGDGWHNAFAGSMHQSSFTAHPIAPIAAGPAPHVQIDDPESGVAVTASSDGMIHVKDDTTFSGWRFGGTQAIPQVQVTRTFDGVHISRADYSTGGISMFSRQHIEVQVPAGAHVTIGHCESAEITGVRNGVEVASQDGHIALRHISGIVNARSDDGHISAEDLSGSAISLVTDDGHITARGIRLLGAAPQAKIHTSDGSLTVSGLFPAGGSYALSTGDGSVHLALAAGSDARIAASTGDGSIEVDGSETDGDDSASRTVQVGGGNASMQVRTEDGSIHISTNGAR